MDEEMNKETSKEQLEVNVEAGNRVKKQGEEKINSEALKEPENKKENEKEQQKNNKQITPKIIFKKFLSLFSTLFLIVLIFIVGALIVQKTKDKESIPEIFGFRLLQVLTGSMSGEFEAGDIIVVKRVKSEDELNRRDIITFKVKEGVLVTHRIVDIIQGKKEREYITRGDANNTEDTQTVLFSNVESKYVFKVPFLGKLINLCNFQSEETEAVE